jgi:alkylhydroperoxidase family enzyme
MADKVPLYELSDLPERQKVALRLADAFIAGPGSIGDGLRTQLREHWSDEEILELMLDICSWSLQKVQVCLALDAPVADELTVLVLDGETAA